MVAIRCKTAYTFGAFAQIPGLMLQTLCFECVTLQQGLLSNPLSTNGVEVFYTVWSYRLQVPGTVGN